MSNSLKHSDSVLSPGVASCSDYAVHGLLDMFCPMWIAVVTRNPDCHSPISITLVRAGSRFRLSASSLVVTPPSAGQGFFHIIEAAQDSSEVRLRTLLLYHAETHSDEHEAPP